ncbi:MAG TPA: iron-containing alcohol dehydrogenase [Thermoleophilaceae bacterium]|nr:iron-containing alcohol dehydrogenase [Thermoleophilaceae bacterium]
METAFTWIDGERLIRFGRGAIAMAPDLLAGRGFEPYVLLTTERAEAASPVLVQGAEAVLHVPSGPVPDAADAVRHGVGGRTLVALGGGRVVDAAKAIAAADGLSCAAVPTTLAGSAWTPFHRMPAGVKASQLVRPALVVWDPDLIETLPREDLVATAMNALAHAFESLYAPLANPVGELAALRAAELLGRELPREQPDREAVALAAMLGGYAVGAAGFAVHHAVCQTTVRTCGVAHAQTNAVVLPHSVRFMADRAPGAVGRFAVALGADGGDPVDAAGRVARLSAETGVEGLAELGVDEDAVPMIVEAIRAHPALGATPGGAPSDEELTAMLLSAL